MLQAGFDADRPPVRTPPADGGEGVRIRTICADSHALSETHNSRLSPVKPVAARDLQLTPSPIRLSPAADDGEIGVSDDECERPVDIGDAPPSRPVC